MLLVKKSLELYNVVHTCNGTVWGDCDLCGAGGSAVWGGITGNIGDQTDLATLLSGKEDVSNKGAANGYASLDGSGKVPSAQLPATTWGSITGTLSSQTDLNTALGLKEVSANKGQINGYASLDGSGKVPSAQLPSYVDDVLEYANTAAFPGTGTSGIIYVAQDSNKTYRWSGSSYVEISPTTPGGSNTQVQFNSSGVLAGSANFVWVNGSSRLDLTGSNRIIYSGDNTKYATLGTNSSGLLSISAVSPFVELYDGTQAYTLRAYNASTENVRMATNGVSFLNGGNFGLGTSSPASKLEIQTNSLGTTQTTSSGIALTNVTAAAAGAQQISPAIRFTGQGWKTATTAASQQVDWQIDNLPVQGSSNPSTKLRFRSSVNGAAYTDQWSIDSNGVLLSDNLNAILRVQQIQTASSQMIIIGNQAAAGGITLSWGANSLSTSGNVYGVKVLDGMSFAAPAGSANFRPIDITYTINNSGAQTGTATGIFLNATESNLNSMTHNLMDLQTGGGSRFLVDRIGNVIATGDLVSTTSGVRLRNLGLVSTTSSGISLLNQGGGGVNIGPTTYNSTSGTTSAVAISGGIASAAGSANYRPLDISYTINNSGAQTGTATGIFLNATVTATNGMAHQLMDLQVGGFSQFKVTNGGTVTANSYIYGSAFGVNSRFVLKAGPVDGTVVLTNTAETDFNRLQFGGTTSSFPALKRNGANLLVRLADDSAYTNITALFTPPAGTTTTAPITLTSGTNKATASEGSIEFSSNVLYFTPTGTDRRMVQLLGRNAQSGTSYTVAASDMGKVIAMTGTAGATVTLPLANSVPAGSIVTIKDEGGAALLNNIVVQTSGSDKIDGQPNQSIVRNYGTMTLYNNGNIDWFITASL